MRGRDLFEKMTDINDEIITEIENISKPKNSLYEMGSDGSLFRFTLNSCTVYISFFNEQDKSPYPVEIVLNFNDKMYSLVNTDKSPAYENYNLEKQITPDMLGEHLSEMTVQIDNDGNKDTFKLYRYNNAPITEYNWFPRIIAESLMAYIIMFNWFCFQ